MALPLSPRRSVAFRRALLVGIAYLLAVQLAFSLMPFTSETLWIWLPLAVEALEAGRPTAILVNPEWWLAVAFPVSVLSLGTLGAYAAFGYENPIPAALAGGLLVALYLTEVIFAGRFEWALLYVLAAPLVAGLAAITHWFGPTRRETAAT
jgi:hypothetical protein